MVPFPRNPFRSMSQVMPDLLLPQRRAIANACAAVDRDRRAAAERATAENSADFESVTRMLGAAPV